ncbi:glycosyltransferase family 4 protein [uncultured Muribaculum sp.]|uniref:glycosyltransferase family 4 protein n=1 Tax=uncultured Muribaculum sp. TaxID=1918613 RepID=UPI00262F9257|nr:glycosyltransferase family 4 protein [uncultured Muribaculum sp.]
MKNSTYRNISKAIHNGFYTNNDISVAISNYRRQGAPLNKIVSLYLKKFFHRSIKHVRQERRTLLLAENREISNILASPISPRDVLLISHEMTLTGAPRALLTVAMTLRDMGYSPTILSLVDGPLSEEAGLNGIKVLITDSELINPYVENALYKTEQDVARQLLDHYKHVIFNTMVSVDILHDFINKDNSIIWIHEAGISYEYLRSPHDTIIDALKKAKDIWIVGEHAKKMFDDYTCHRIESSIFLYGIPAINNISIPSTEENNISHDKINILMSGMMGTRKGTDLLLDAVKLLSPEELSRLRIHLIGGCCENSIKTKIENAGDSILWWGQQPHDKVLSAMSDMQALICPSIDDPMPIVCTEAFQQHIPVLTSDATGTASLIKDGGDGMIFTSGSPKAIADTLRRVITTPPSELKRIGDNGYKIYTEHFSLQIFSKNLSKYFPPLVNKA